MDTIESRGDRKGGVMLVGWRELERKERGARTEATRRMEAEGVRKEEDMKLGGGIKGG